MSLASPPCCLPRVGRRATLLLVALLTGLGACKSAYYGALEKLGIEKREILVDRVEEGREAQAEAKEQFRSALDAFRALTGFEGGALGDVYADLDREYEQSRDRAADVRERIDAIESVAADLFEEWADEIDEMRDRELRRKSEGLLADTQERYDELAAAMERAAERMEPVLTTLRDHVLFLKHNLNAQAVAGLGGEVASIEADVDALVRDLEAAIAEADRFLAAMEA